ncbi:MAG: hypothetical protein SVY53_05240 [Chloroflexota bacterium]|nr:hypothetical protein [Chloroflexota bacterium]
MRPRQIIDCLKEVGRYRFERLLSNYGEDVIEAAIACDVSLNDIEESYVGYYFNKKEFAQKMILDRELLTDYCIPPWIHIDWDRTATDLMMDYVEDDGHYFRMM